MHIYVQCSKHQNLLVPAGQLRPIRWFDIGDHVIVEDCPDVPVLTIASGPVIYTGSFHPDNYNVRYIVRGDINSHPPNYCTSRKDNEDCVFDVFFVYARVLQPAVSTLFLRKIRMEKMLCQSTLTANRTGDS